MTSEVQDLKNSWFVFSKKIGQVLTMMPVETMTTYEMIVKSLPIPNFEIHRYSEDKSLYDILNEITARMANYYLQIFQALFSNDADSIRME